MSDNIHSIFKKIIDRKEPAQIIYEDDQAIAIMDKFPYNPGHFLVIPKKHSTNLKDIEEQSINHLMKIAIKLAKEKNWK